MNGIEKILDRIRDDAQAEADRILAEARSEAADITAAYEARARSEAAEILARGEKAAAQREERLTSVAQLECRKAQLAARQEVVDEAFGLALTKLLALPPEEYAALLVRLAVQAAPNGGGKLIFSPSDRARVGKAVVLTANKKLGGGQLTLSGETRPMRGGFVLSNGAVEVNCTFDALIRLERTALAGQVAKVLFD